MSWALGAGVGAIGAVGGLLWALAPAIHYDSLVYHLGVTTLYVRQHGIIEVPEEFRSYWAHNAEMLYTLGLSLAGQPVPGLLHWTASTLAAGFVYLGGRRLAGVRTGLLAAALFFTMPMVTWLAGTTYVDLFPTVYVAAMLYAFYVWTQAENDAWLTLSGVVAGLAMSIKLTAGLELLPLSLSLLGAAVLRYGWSLRTLQVLLRFSLPVVILFAPWLIRDAVWTGNPVFPYLNGVFQSPDWPATNTLLNFSTYGRGHGLTDFLRLPWDLTFHTGDFAEGTPAGALGAVPILALPWLYLRPALTRRRLALVALYCLGVIVPWFFVAQYLRYLMPVLPVLSILAALNLAAAWGVLSSRLSERTGFWLALVLGGLLLLAGRASHLRSLWNIPERYPFGVVFGLERSSEFLSRALKYYDAFQFLNRQEPAGGKILAIGLSHRLYSDWRVHSLNTYDVLALTTSAAPGPVLAQALREFGTSYLVLDTDEIQRQPERWPPFASDERFLSQYAQLVFAGNGHEAYRLRPAPLDESASGPASLLVNGDFELEEPGGELAYWHAHGSPRYDRTGRAARHGNGAIELAGDDWYSQAVAVAADEVYSLGYWAQTDQPGALARLQINWRDAQSQQIDVSIVVVAPGAAWQWFEMSQTSPQGAVGAVIYVVAHGEAAIWFDDVTFVRGEIPPLPR
jgi:hypothetical protein